jgi:ABC-type Fe3+ transport system substrate-binding protein
LLPCPVRIPLLEGFDNFNKEYQKKTGLSVGYKLEAASVGAEWIEKNISNIEDPDELPDLFISAGFETFFDRKTIGRFKENNIFKDMTDFELNSDFKDADVLDPKKHYSIISVVPSVFMVNLPELGDLPVPRTWEDILKEEYEQKVSLPVGDFDLFNAILINMYKDFGEEGVEKMGRSLLKSMHPSQMVKNAKKVQAEKPAITIMPYFFTRMMHGVKTMEIVWPEDGAIISPVFMLSKAQMEKELKPIADFFAGKEVGEILSHKGLFPSLNAEVKNPLPDKAPFKWVGWDYIYNNDIGKLIKKTNEIFENYSEKVEI